MTMADDFAHEMDKIVLGVIGEVFDWRPRFGDEAKTHLLSIRVPESAHRVISLMLQEFHMVYGTQSDLCRDAVWFFAYFLYTLNKSGNQEVRHILDQAKAAGDARYTANLRRQIRQHLNDLHDSLLDAFADGHLEECHRQVEQFWGAVGNNPNPWVREKYLAAASGSALLKAVCGTLKRFGYRLDTAIVIMYT